MQNNNGVGFGQTSLRQFIFIEEFLKTPKELKDEQAAIFKMIDLAISNKKMKDNLSQLIAQ